MSLHFFVHYNFLDNVSACWYFPSIPGKYSEREIQATIIAWKHNELQEKPRIEFILKNWQNLPLDSIV